MHSQYMSPDPSHLARHLMQDCFPPLAGQQMGLGRSSVFMLTATLNNSSSLRTILCFVFNSVNQDFFSRANGPLAQ